MGLYGYVKSYLLLHSTNLVNNFVASSLLEF
jgi:hypothetical protein